MKVLTDFPNFEPQAVASQGNAVLGIRDSGKSYTAVGIAERFHDAGIPFVAFDPIGKWRFLRVPGAGHGYPIVVAGGAAGDLPLTTDSASAIVRAAMENGISLVIDLYDMDVSKADWKRIVADSVHVLLYENGSHGLRHIFIEEAAEFCPQRVGPDQGRVYAEIEKLARMGGNARLGYTLINQRAEEVNKAVLELCDNLFLHRQKGRNSLNALTKWLDVADVRAGREIVSTLPTLPQGECWAWMAGTERPVHVKVPAKSSFEPDRRAMRGEVVPEKRGVVDVASFVAAMKAQMEGRKAEAPAPKAKPQPAPKIEEDKDVKESEARALRAENDRMKQELAALRNQATPAAREPGGLYGGAQVPDMDAIWAEVKRRAQNDPALLRVLASKPEIEVAVSRSVVQIDGTSLKGRIAQLLAEGFMDTGVTQSAVRNELKRRGSEPNFGNLSRTMTDLHHDGFLTRAGDTFHPVEGMKVNLIET